MVTSQPGLGFAITQRILLLFFIPDKRRSPHKRALMTICCDLHGKEKPLSSPSQEIVDSDFRHGRILAIREEEQGHFWPCQLWSLTPSISLEGGRKWGSLLVKKGEFLVFFHFLQRTCMISHLFPAVFPKSAANMQQSTLKEVSNWEKRAGEKRAESYGTISVKINNQLKQ